MEVLHLLRGGDRGPLRRALAICCLAGLANAVLVGLINAVAAQAARGEPVGARSTVLFVLAFATFYLAQRTSLRLANGALGARLAALRLRLADKIRRAELRVLEGIGRGELYTKVAQETNHLSQAFPILLTAAQGGFLLAFCMLYVAYLSLPAFVVVAVVTGLALLVFAVRRQALVRELAAVTAQEGAMLDALTHYLEGFQELRLGAARNAAVHAHFAGVVEKLERLVVAIGDGWVFLLMFSSAFVYLILGAVIFLLPPFFPGYSAGIYKLTAAALFCTGPVTAITAVAPVYTKATVGLRQVRELEARLDAGLEEPPAAPAPPGHFADFREITCRGLAFSYRDKQGVTTFTSGPWDLALRRGEVLFVVGGNGSGKSTALKLLSGLYRPDAGRLEVDGEPVGPANLGAYRALFSCIFSDFHLFDRLHGLGEVDPAVVREALARMELAGRVGFEGGRFTDLRLSTGQRKRLALVVAELEDREVLVFDEWAADQERRFREVFYAEILPALKARGKTVVVVTHDDRFFGHGDRLVRLDRGALVGAQGAACPS